MKIPLFVICEYEQGGEFCDGGYLHNIQTGEEIYDEFGEMKNCPMCDHGYALFGTINVTIKVDWDSDE